MIPYMIAIDWLQVSGRLASTPPESVYINKYKDLDPFVAKVDLIDSSKYSPMFTAVKDVVADGVIYAQLSYCPRTSALAPDRATLKLENRVLYCQDRIKILYQICQAVGLEITGLTRLDLCYDCNKLANNMDPGDFIYQYVCNKPGVKGHIHRSGSTRFVANGSRKWHQHTKITSIRFGSKHSAIGAYIYNKTLELIEVKDKPWIRDAWERAGLISRTSPELGSMSKTERDYMVREHSLADYCQNSVWRFEISIKSEGKDLLCLGDGNLFKLSCADAENQLDVEELFYIYAQKAFDFRRNTGQKNIRHYKPMRLFVRGDVPCNYRPVHVSKMLDCGRTEKVCANKLDKLLRTYIDMPTNLRTSVSDTIKFLQQISGRKRRVYEHRQYAHYLDQLAGSEFYRRSLADAVKVSLRSEILRYLAADRLGGEVVGYDDVNQMMQDYIAVKPSSPLEPIHSKNTPAKPADNINADDGFDPYNYI